MAGYIPHKYTNCSSTRPLICPYCGAPSKIVTGEDLFPHLPHLKDRYFYRCEPCDAHVGCHKHSTVPMGTIADAALRKIRADTHRVFDMLWREGSMPRYKAYSWLAQKLDLSQRQCHIGDFDEGMCFKVQELCKEFLDVEANV